MSVTEVHTLYESIHMKDQNRDPTEIERKLVAA